jgi:NDP-sugar pyrophosphorylase family protein
MKAVILAGGLGTRLRPFTEIIPKPLLPLGEKSVLEIQIERLRQSGFDEIFLATNYKSEYFENYFRDDSLYGGTLTISREEKPLGTAGPLMLLRDRLTEPFLVMNGDILSLIDLAKLYEFALEKNAWLTVCIKKHITPFAFGDILFNGDHVTHIEEKPEIIKYILAGIYVMKPEIFSLIPPDRYYGMDTLIKKMLGERVPVVKYEITEYWLDIGQIEDYRTAQEMYERHFKTEESA